MKINGKDILVGGVLACLLGMGCIFAMSMAVSPKSQPVTRPNILLNQEAEETDLQLSQLFQQKFQKIGSFVEREGKSFIKTLLLEKGNKANQAEASKKLNALVKVSNRIPEDIKASILQEQQKIADNDKFAMRKGELSTLEIPAAAPESMSIQTKAQRDYDLAIQYISQDKLDRAQKLLEKNIAVLPSHIASRFELGLLYFKKNKLQKAEDLLDDGLKLDPDNQDLLKLMAMVYDKQGNLNKALFIAEQITLQRKQNPRYIDNTPVKTLALQGVSDPHTASGLADRGHFSKSPSGTNPNKIDHVFRSATLTNAQDTSLARNGNLTSAAEKPVRQDPHQMQASLDSQEDALFSKTSPTLSIEEDAMYVYYLALEHVNKREVAVAEKLLTGLLQKMPTHHAARAELATLYFNQGMIDKTEFLVVEGLTLDESYADFLRLMAMVHDARGEPEKALGLLTRVKDSGRENKNYIAFLAYVYQQTGRYSLARQQYFRLLQIEPKNAHWLLGVSVALDFEGQKEAALEGYHKLADEGSVDANVIQFIQERIRDLKG